MSEIRHSLCVLTWLRLCVPREGRWLSEIRHSLCVLIGCVLCREGRLPSEIRHSLCVLPWLQNREGGWLSEIRHALCVLPWLQNREGGWCVRNTPFPVCFDLVVFCREGGWLCQKYAMPCVFRPGCGCVYLERVVDVSEIRHSLCVLIGCVLCRVEGRWLCQIFF